MKKSLALLLFACLSLFSYSQHLVTGTVIDAETQEPLSGASVFAQNTTKGTMTDKEGNFQLTLPTGGYELVVSFTGYVNRTINLDLTEDRQFKLSMQKADNSMSEVVIRNTSEVTDGWEKYGKLFTDLFIGTTPFSDSCTLLNPGALKFYYFKRNQRLKVLATEPLEIKNNSLGYLIRYQLDSFVHYFPKNLNSYGGLCFFQQLEGTEEELQKWEQNRRNVYFGSRIHFLRSYYDSLLKEEGFSVELVSKKDRAKYLAIPNPYDSSYYFFDDSTGNAELWFPDLVSISYRKKAPEKQYLKQKNLAPTVMYQISYVSLKDAIIINPNGYFTEQKSWINQGYWSWKNVADLLPYDYEPVE